jgi:hypothetical protein
MSPENRSLIGRSLVVVANCAAGVIFTAGMAETLSVNDSCEPIPGVISLIDTTGQAPSQVAPESVPTAPGPYADSYNVPVPNECA